jgi:hypothetical protein
VRPTGRRQATTRWTVRVTPGRSNSAGNSWQQRIDAEASEFGGTASRFGDLLENDLPRTEEHLLALIRSLEAARRVQAPGG